MQLFTFLAAILNLKVKETFEKCIVNQLLQPMAIVIGSMLRRRIEVFPSMLPPKNIQHATVSEKKKLSGLKWIRKLPH